MSEIHYIKEYREFGVEDGWSYRDWDQMLEDLEQTMSFEDCQESDRGIVFLISEDGAARPLASVHEFTEYTYNEELDSLDPVGNPSFSLQSGDPVTYYNDTPPTQSVTIYLNFKAFICPRRGLPMIAYEVVVDNEHSIETTASSVEEVESWNASELKIYSLASEYEDILENKCALISYY